MRQVGTGARSRVVEERVRGRRAVGVPSSISTGVEVSVFVPLLIESVFVIPATVAGNGNSTVTPAA